MFLKHGPTRLINTAHIVDLHVTEGGDIAFKLSTHVRATEVVPLEDHADWRAWIEANRFHAPAPAAAPEVTPSAEPPAEAPKPRATRKPKAEPVAPPVDPPAPVEPPAPIEPPAEEPPAAPPAE